MLFTDIFFSYRVIISILLVVLISLALTFLPLIGTLGFEFSAVISVVLAFVSVFIASEFVNYDLRKGFGRERRFSDLALTIFFTNYIVTAFPFAIALISYLIKGDCSAKEGTIFYILIPIITVFFSTSLGLLIGVLFPRWGFFVGVLIVIGTICFSLWNVYHNPSFFFYNPIFGFFPGPLYDEVIPITTTLVVYRLTTICWGFLLLIILKLIRGFKHGTIGFSDVAGFLIVVGILTIAYTKESDIGINYTREDIVQNYLPASYETEYFIIYYSPGSSEAENIELIADDHEWRHKQLSDFLKTNSNEKIRAYLYPDTDTRKKLIGAGETTMANPITKEIHLIYDVFPNPILKHELTHVLSSEFGIDFLHISPKVGLIEGLAVASDWTSMNYNSHQWTKALIELGETPEIGDIAGVGFWYSPPRNSYTMMGSFSRYLIDTYGIEKFKILYKTGDFSVHGKSLEELTSEWKLFLENVDVPDEIYVLAQYRFSEPSIFQGNCPRKVAALKKAGLEDYEDGDLFKAREHFLEALSFNKNDPVLIDSLAYCYYFNKEYEKLIGLINSGISIPKVDEDILQNLRANALWQEERVREAESLYREILGHPITNSLEREIDIKISAMNAGESIEENIREFFSTKDELIQITELEESIRNFPYYSPSYYLLGRMLFNDGEYERALYYLSESEKLGLPSVKLRIENLRLLGITFYTIGDYDGAIRKFRKILFLEPNGVLTDYAKDFIERSEWAKDRKLNG